MDTSKYSVEIEDCFTSLLEFAANDDVESFKRSIELDLSGVDKVGSWYVLKQGSKQIAEEERTPLMVAATYGSLHVLKLIVALPEVDLNRSCGRDQWTALHCAAFGGSVYAFDVVKMLLSAGADPNVEDVNGQRPIDVILVPPNIARSRADIQELLSNYGSAADCNLHFSYPPLECRSPSSVVDTGSPANMKFSDVFANSVAEKKQYPVDPSIPDIRNSIYSTDEFRMFSFKVRPCSRAYSHDWTECPFVHPGENARRRDPRKFHYSCVPCLEFRKGACRRGEMCEYAHGVFECWLHPAQYRTRLCKDGTACARQVCFFAHAQDELRPLHFSTGCGDPSPRAVASAASYMDMAGSLSLLPCSPPAHAAIVSPVFDQNRSPVGNGAWPQPNVPSLHLPGNNFQSSRLRSSVSARDFPHENQNMLQDYDLACFPQPHSTALLNRSTRSNSSLTPSNLEDLFMADFASPRFSDLSASPGVHSPTHKSALRIQFQQQQSSLSPLNTNTFSPRIAEHPLLQASLGNSSPRMSPRSLESSSPLSTRLSFSHLGNQQQQQFNPGSFRTPVVRSPAASWSTTEPSYGKVDWSVNPENLVSLNKSTSVNGGTTDDEPDFSWVTPLVKETSPAMIDHPVAEPSSEVLKSNPEIETTDHSVLGAWLEQMQLDQLVV